MNSPFVAGLVVGLVTWSLMSQRPLLRDALVAVASASVMDVLTGKRSPEDVGSIIERLSGGVAIHPDFMFGVISAAMGATLLALICTQPQNDRPQNDRPRSDRPTNCPRPRADRCPDCGCTRRMCAGD